MMIQHMRVRPGSARTLIAVLLLAGVFTMHGLTGNHDAAMAITHQMPAVPAADQPALPAAAPSAAGHRKPATSTMAHLSTIEIDSAAPSVHSSPVPPRPVVTVDPGHDGHLHAMGDVCLAMLAALLLALIVALARRSHAVAHPIPLAGPAVLVAADGPSPPWRQPTLSKLCVLRT